MSIIGVVAALTVPSLVFKNREKETVVRLKKVYSLLNSAYSLAQINYGSPDEWGLSPEARGANNLINAMGHYLNFSKVCYQGKGCFADVLYKNYDGSGFRNINADNRNVKAILADGMSIELFGYDEKCETVIGSSEALKAICGGFFVDIDGVGGANRGGVDLFSFHLTKFGIVPNGTSDINSNYSGNISKCRIHGHTCSAWVILKENVNYPNIGSGWE